MLPLREATLTCNSRLGAPSSGTWLYLSTEFLVGVVISTFLAILRVIKVLLPKPPRDVRGDVVLVTGATTSLGSSLAEEFAKNGCSVICVDANLPSVEAIASRIRSKYPPLENVGPGHRKHDQSSLRLTTFAYECNLYDRTDILSFARKVKDEVGRVDVLITCTGNPSEDIFDTVSKTLMSHYWTVIAFLPLMLRRKRAHVIGVIPTSSSEDAYLGSKAAVAGLIESLSESFNDHSSHLNFIAIAPVIEPRQNDTEKQVAKDAVQAVKMGHHSLTINWSSRILYSISHGIHRCLNSIIQYADE